MPPPTQTYRPMAVGTPLGEDKLLLVGFSGHEGLSQLFRFQLDVIAENQTEVAFDKLLGQPLVVRLELPGQQQRYFHGICSRVSQGESDNTYTAYRLEMVPAFWLLTRRSQSRIFQHKNVPDILKEVLAGLDVAYQIQGTFHPRDYCVQYRETDGNFASRLMEEEGIYYFFKHAEGGSQMVLANTPAGHPDLPTGSQIVYRNLSQGSALDEDLIYDWNKTQELTPGKYTLWDHCFELPHKHLEAERPIQESVQVGEVAHKLKVGENGKLEVYDWPGAYAQRFDGIDRGGGERPADLEKIFEDNKRTVEIRMQQEAVTSVEVQGGGNCRQLVSGHKFTLTTLPADPLTKPQKAEGAYVLTTVSHAARVGSDYRAGDWSGFDYSNHFTCIPAALPFRPRRTILKPAVAGTQTAVVVGPSGEEIFCDKYGRVKVQFHWDRQGKYDADSSCWVRVATIWAGKTWGIVNVPRIGQEVVVDFLEGDPDQPIIVGSVFNADHVPPMDLPKEKMISGLRSNSTPGGGGYNGLIFDDTKGKEQITLHGQYDMATTIEHDDTQTIHNNRTITVDGTHTETITKDTKITVEKGTYSHDVAGNKATYHVKGDLAENYDATQKTTVKSNITITSVEGEILIDAAKKITLHTGESKLTMEASGKITLSGVNIVVTGKADIKESAPNIDLTGTKQTVMGVGPQTVTCDTAKVVTSGTAISSTAVGVHEISGAMVKIN